MIETQELPYGTSVSSASKKEKEINSPTATLHAFITNILPSATLEELTIMRKKPLEAEVFLKNKVAPNICLRNPFVEKCKCFWGH